MEKKKLTKTKKVEFEEEVVSYVKQEYERRREERFALEKQWELNLNFMAGKQYVNLNSRGEIIEEEKSFFWQKREVFNHIAPIVELRSAKMSKIKPVFSVKANNDDDKEIKNAQLAEKILNSTMKKIALKKTVEEATIWSETTGTAFYKVLWNTNGGAKVGEQGGQSVYEGEVEVLAISPFEIFPDVLTVENVESNKSIIHAKVMTVSEVYSLYGVKVKGEKEKIAVKIENADNYFELKKLSEKSQKINELKEKRKADLFEQYDYNMKQQEKEIKNLNMLNRARMHLSLEYIAITHEPLTNPQKDALGYFKDVIKVLDQYFYTLDADTAYDEFLREGVFTYYLTDSYYSLMREKYKARADRE